jgi:hypothetical protein
MTLKSFKIVTHALYFWKSLHSTLNVLKKPRILLKTSHHFKKASLSLKIFLKSLEIKKLIKKAFVSLKMSSKRLKKSLKFSENIYIMPRNLEILTKTASRQFSLCHNGQSAPEKTFNHVR